ncbi:hypothetical protein THASP1DRAFT_10901, partial [Thamnocephalis sphaerospora]
FIRDATIPDGTPVPAGEIFYKSWLITNNGASTWPEGTLLAQVGGDDMNAAAVKVPALASGQTEGVGVNMQAPMCAGSKTSFWRLITPEGERFGARLWCEITVL